MLLVTAAIGAGLCRLRMTQELLQEISAIPRRLIAWLVSGMIFR
jgi:hypothetical protein